MIIIFWLIGRVKVPRELLPDILDYYIYDGEIMSILKKLKNIILIKLKMYLVTHFLITGLIMVGSGS